MIRSLTSAIFFIALAPSTVLSENLGTKAQTYQLDPDGRDQFKEVMRQKQQSGDLDRFWTSYRNKTLDAIKHPAPLSGISSNYSFHAAVFDPKFTIPYDYRNEKGQIVVKRGTVVEPLHINPLVNGLIFIDGTDDKQVIYAIERGQKEPLKIVLTAGSPLDLRIKYQRTNWRGNVGVPFYFDQRKIILDSLQRLYGIAINTVPVVLAQRGDNLMVEFGIKD